MLIVSILINSCNHNQAREINAKPQVQKPEYALVIHGGAGDINPQKLPEEIRRKYRKALAAALKAGEDVLKDGGGAMDAVIAAIMIMEDDTLFNAAKGAVLTEAGTAELDASLMTGHDLNAGAIAGAKHIKNPILAAREVMLNSKHVMLAGDGADRFAAERNLDTVAQHYFITAHRKKQLQEYVHGTVGAVALDKKGNIAAGTSTGGMTAKKWGRIGDSPIIGAGTYADNRSCGVSATGHGEYFIRNAVAYDIHARMRYKNQSLDSAAREVVHNVLKEKFDASGGIVALDKSGNIVMEFNTTAMFRGYVKAGEKSFTAIFR